MGESPVPLRRMILHQVPDPVLECGHDWAGLNSRGSTRLRDQGSVTGEKACVLAQGCPRTLGSNGNCTVSSKWDQKESVSESDALITHKIYSSITITQCPDHFQFPLISELLLHGWFVESGSRQGSHPGPGQASRDDGLYLGPLPDGGAVREAV